MKGKPYNTKNIIQKYNITWEVGNQRPIFIPR